MNKAYLKGRVHEGQFSSELGFVAKDYNDNLMSGFFDKTNIKQGRLEVSVVGEEDDARLIMPPAPFLERNSMIYVRESDLMFK